MAVKIQKGKKVVAKGSAKAGSQELQTAVAEITKVYKDGAKTVEHEEIGAVHGPGPFANVGVTASRTISKDYNSSKVQISLHVPCPVDEKEINDTFTFCYGWVEQKMEEALAEIDSA